MTASGTPSDNDWQQMTTSGTTSDNDWQVVQRMTTSGTTNNIEWPFWLIFPFFEIREEPTIKHPKENSLNIEEDLWKKPIELREKTSS